MRPARAPAPCCFIFCPCPKSTRVAKFLRPKQKVGKLADSEESVAAPAIEAPPEEAEDASAPNKSSSELLEEIFDAFLSTSSAVVVDKKKKHSSSKHKKKKKHKDKDKKRHKEKKSKRSRRSASTDAFYEAAPPGADGDAERDARRCDLFAAGELDSDEEKALSFDCFVERPPDNGT
jgi:hypothetical protein